MKPSPKLSRRSPVAPARDDVATTKLCLPSKPVEAAGASVELVLVLVDRQEGAGNSLPKRAIASGQFSAREDVMEADPVSA